MFVGLGVGLCLVILQVLRTVVILLIVFWRCLRVFDVIGFNSVVIFNSLLIRLSGLSDLLGFIVGVYSCLLFACDFCGLCQFGYLDLFMLVFRLLAGVIVAHALG